MPGKNPKTSRSRQQDGAKQGAVRGKEAAAPRVGKAIARKDSAKRAAPGNVARITPIVDLGKIWDEIGKRRPFEFRVSFVRPDDLLVCDFILDNLKLSSDGQLVRTVPTRPATLILELPPQSFGEQAFLDDPDLEAHGPLPFAKIRMAGRSRIAFAMPAEESTLNFTADAILDACRRWPVRLDVNAVPEPPEREIIFRKAAQGISAFDKDWLAALTSSPDWAEATQTLIGALDGDGMIQERVDAAAVRIANQAAHGLNTRQRRGLATTLTRTMTKELDALVADYPQLREGQPREFALATLALASSKALAASNVSEFDIGAVKYLPFLPIIFAPHKPAPTVTSLELPYRVMLSPIPPSGWWHATEPVVHNGRTEVWHTRLTNTKDGIGADPATKVRAIWSPDYDGLTDEEIVQIVNNLRPFRMSLDALDRQMLVKLMADFTQLDPDRHAFVPRPATSRRLALSALGALLDAEASWSVLPAGVGLEQWRHMATLGRDAYVRVVYKGYLCPFGHSTSLIKVTERKFEYQDGTTKNRVALLRQRFFLVVREPVKPYSGTGHAWGGRNFPFTSVEILTRVTPNLVAPDFSKLSDPSNKIYSAVPNRACFWPMLAANKDFLFQVAATDICGERVTFAMPLLFVGAEANQKPITLAEILKRYAAEASPRRTAALGNAAVCYAPVKPGAEGDPRLPTGNMTFDAAGVKGVSKSKPQFYPEVESAEVGIAAIQRLLQKPDAVVPVTYPDVYKSSGFGGANPGEVFLKTLQAFGLEFGDAVKSDTLGGLATPSMAIQGLSRIMGPVAAKPPADPKDIEAALGNVINNTFDPTDFFKGAKILGGIELADLLQVAASLAGVDVPKLLSKQLPDKIEARFDWQTDIHKSDPLGLFVPNPDGAPSSLDMHGVVSSPIAKPSATTFNANATLVHFKINLFGFIILWFDKLSFTSQTGSKPDVSVDLHPGDRTIEFGGPLEFVNELRKIIPSNGFSDSAGLSVTPSGIGANFSLNLPSLGVGIFALEHISLGAGFALPFDAKPAQVRFNFAERQSPFTLSVSFLGGGGFFAIGVSTQGVNEIEAALEFGAGLSIDLGVASGSVEIKAGVYFHWKTASVELSGYVRLHGELSVLGLISASLTFNLQLTYLKENGHSVVWGEATLTIEIEILFFSMDVSVKCRREFGGSNADPKFIDLIPDQATWAKYCEAFAVEAG